MGTEEVRHRVLDLDPNKGSNPTPATYTYRYFVNPTGIVNDKGVRPLLRGLQSTVSTGNDWPPQQRGSITQDRGSAFSTVRHEYESSSPMTQYHGWSTEMYRGLPAHEYRGWLSTRSRSGGPSDFPPSPASSYQTLLSKGATAIARTIPTNSAADVATFLGELREGLPSIIGSAMFKSGFRDYRKVGGEYLNVEFGWKPLISDVQKFYTAVKDSDKILAQLRRDSGRNVRRKYRFPIETDTTETVMLTGRTASPWPINNTGYQVLVSNGANARLTKTTKVTREVWFSGCYTYYLDPGDTAMGKAVRFQQEAAKLLGLELTLETLWNLAPWSWAVDWFTNVGDVIHNMVAFSQDGLVMRYGYLMETAIHEETYTMTGIKSQQGNIPDSLTETFRTISKTRIKASPWGFGFNGGISNRQLAIVAALGISRGPGSSGPGRGY